MANENEVADFRRNFLSSYANADYKKYQAIRERVRDCVSGTATMKGIGGNSQSGGGNDFTSVQKYLLPTQRQLKHPDEYLRYLMMADFPGYAQTACLVALGLVAAGEDTIKGAEHLPESLQLMNTTDNAVNAKLMSLRVSINRGQMIDGGRVNFLEVSPQEQIAAGKSPFYINSYPLDKFVICQLDSRLGNQFVLMDESDWVFNYALKVTIYENRYRVFGIDARGFYYQAAIRAEQWPSFNVAEPEQWDNEIAVQNPNDPQFGRAFYPQFNDYLQEIPVDFCFVTHHNPMKYEEPMLAPVADKDILIYNADAAYRQTLWLTSQPINVIYNDGKDRKLPYGAGAVHNLPKEAREQWLEFTGAGANAQRTALDDLHRHAESKTMSLLSNNASNMSGEALKLIQGSQVAPLISLVKTSGESITRLLRIAAKWAGLDRDKANEITYVPSEVYSKMNLQPSDILTLIQAKHSNPSTPVLWSEIRRRLVESGVGDEESGDFDSFMDKIMAENETMDELNPPEQTRFPLNEEPEEEQEEEQGSSNPQEPDQAAASRKNRKLQSGS